MDKQAAQYYIKYEYNINKPGSIKLINYLAGQYLQQEDIKRIIQKVFKELEKKLPVGEYTVDLTKDNIIVE